jgi:beta-propeller repeat-containing protein
MLAKVSTLALATGAMVVNMSFPWGGVARAELQYQVEWIRQIGTSDSEGSNSVAVDGAGNVFITGYTTGGLGGPNLGELDVFLTKYDLAGNELWTRHSGTRDDDNSFSVAADSAGNTYIGGYNKGSLDGPNPGYAYHDAYLTKFDPMGVEVWSQQIGSINQDYGFAVTVDGQDNIYLSGSAAGSLGGPHAGHDDAFLIKFDPSGAEFWSRQIGTPNDDVARSVAVDNAGNVYISGSTFGSLGGPNAGFNDAFVTKFDPSGGDLWTRQIGTMERDNSTSVAVDLAGNVYITGFTSGSLGGANQGGSDAYLTKFDPAGTELWSRQVGTFLSDASYSVAVDKAGNAYITGSTGDSLAGPRVGGLSDAFLMKYDPTGTQLWSQQIGTTGTDVSTSVAVDGEGNVFISGYTRGNFDGLNKGRQDAFLVKFTAPIAGDLDGDGFVGITDLAMILAAWNQTVPLSDPLADPTGDGFVGIEDLNIVLGNWDVGVPPQLPIPEPATFMLITFMGLVLEFRRPGAASRMRCRLS